MALSRRLRYEVLRRDDHTCRYCGGTAPDVKLTIDHVVPSTLGGSDEPSNLVTACADCNAGKSSVAPDSPIVEGVADDALRWGLAIEAAAKEQATLAVARFMYIQTFDNVWRVCEAEYGEAPRPDDWSVTVGRHFDLGMSTETITVLIEDVLPRNVYYDQKWRYFCGALRNVVRDLHDRAAEIIAQESET